MSDTARSNVVDFEKRNPQITVTGKIKQTRHNTETLCFSFNLGPIKVICIANIPEEGKEESPVYVKFEFNTGK